VGLPLVAIALPAALSQGGAASVFDGAQWGVIDESSYSRELNLSYRDPHFGFFDREGTIVIPYRYDAARNYVEGLAVVGIKID